MTMKSLLTASFAALAITVTASAALACTQEELTAKVNEMSVVMQEAIMKDPSQAEVIMGKVQGIQGKIEGVTDVKQLCTIYDELLVELKN